MDLDTTRRVVTELLEHDTTCQWLRELHQALTGRLEASGYVASGQAVFSKASTLGTAMQVHLRQALLDPAHDLPMPLQLQLDLCYHVSWVPSDWGSADASVYLGFVNEADGSWNGLLDAKLHATMGYDFDDEPDWALALARYLEAARRDDAQHLLDRIDRACLQMAALPAC